MRTSLIAPDIEIVGKREIRVVLDVESVATEELVDVGIRLGLGHGHELRPANVKPWRYPDRGIR